MEEEIHKWYISAGVIGCFHNWESKTALNAKFILTISPKSLHIAHIWWMNLNHIISGRRFCGLNLLTRSWRVSIHCPITLYPGVLLIFIWYWKRSYRPGASPFRLNVTDVPALPAKDRLRLRNLPSTLSDEYTAYQSYIMKKNALTCLEDNKTPLFAFPIRTETKVSLVVTGIQTMCAPQANSGDWQNLTFITIRLFEELYLQGLALTITNLPKHNQQCGFLEHRWNARLSLWTADTSSSHLLHWDSWVVQGSYQ